MKWFRDAHTRGFQTGAWPTLPSVKECDVVGQERRRAAHSSWSRWRCCARARRDSHHPQRAPCCSPAAPAVPRSPCAHRTHCAQSGLRSGACYHGQNCFCLQCYGYFCLYTTSLPASSLLPQLLMATSSCRRVAGIAHTQHKSNFPRTYLLTPKMFQIRSLTISGHTWAFSACEARAGRKQETV